jgi:hypothetical protein
MTEWVKKTWNAAVYILQTAVKWNSLSWDVKWVFIFLSEILFIEAEVLSES